MATFQSFRKFTEELPEQEKAAPVLFVGHGSPMNGIEDNEFSRRWQQMGETIEKPAAVLCVSAHWYTRGTHITAMENPRTIHDFYGFPQELFNVQYPSPGHPGLAKQAASLIKKTEVGLDHEWGLDHGTWSVVRNMYPNADIPVLQLSIDYSQKPEYHYELAKEMATLRKKGVLIVGSGNMVHNLRIMDWNRQDEGYDWAVEMNDKFKNLIAERDHGALMDYTGLGKEAMLSIPTPEHYLPLLYVLALQGKNEEAAFFNDKAVMGSITMTSVLIG